MANAIQSLSDAKWHCEPPSWDLTENALTLTTGEKTDFWQNTFYGFRRDDGHFLGKALTDGFTAHLDFEADYDVLYDQAGLMMRADAETWVKTGIEYSDEVTNFSTVVTRNGQSDWSVISLPKLTGTQHVRLTRTRGAVVTHFQDAKGQWQLMRLADFPEEMMVSVGPMACSPERAGLKARFTGFEIGLPLESPLHAT